MIYVLLIIAAQLGIIIFWLVWIARKSETMIILPPPEADPMKPANPQIQWYTGE